MTATSEKKVGETIRQARRAADMTQAELAVLVFGDAGRQSHIARLEAGKHEPRPQTAEAIFKALNLPVRDIQV